jgi:hypothetical protein
VPASAITRLPAARRNELLERLSRQARRLRGGIGAGGVPDLAKVGRSDALEQLTVRLGVIPVVTIPNPTPGVAYVQAFPADRPAGSEQVSVSGGSAPQGFLPGDQLRPVPFDAPAGTKVLTATDSVDASATGRATTTVS